MQKEWRRYVVFISSTFKDMDSERDAIKFQVIPRLNRYYRNRMVEIQAIDLRLGINTENMDEVESQNKVLDICMSCIESAHPFFIGLLGDRYGWIPSEQRWMDFINKQNKVVQPLLSRAIGKSVTELEILWGVFKKNINNHALFFVRDKASYKNMPKNKLSVFRDVDDVSLSPEDRNIKKQHMDALNNKIFDAFGNNSDLWTKYHLDWDNEKQCFEGLENFCDKVAERLIKQIDSELDSSGDDDYTWLKYEQQNICSILSHNIQHTLPRTNHYAITDYDQILFAGKTGCGKSVLLAQYCEKSMHDPSTITLYADVGSSKYSLNIRYIITRWLYELRDALNEDVELDEKKFLSEDTPLQHLYNMFSILINTAASQGRVVSVFMDSIERFAEVSPGDLYLVWINPAIKFMGSINTNMVDKATTYNKQLKVINVELPQNAELNSLIHHFEKEYHIELQRDIYKALLQMPVSFLFLQALFKSFSMLSNKDFLKIRSSDKDPMAAINSYLWDIFIQIPRNDELIFPFLLRNVAERVNSMTQVRVFDYLSLAPMGLRESDMEILMGEDWNAIDFYTIVNVLSEMFIEDPSQHHWKIASPHMGETLVPAVERKRVYTEIAIAMSKIDDYGRDRFWAYYIIKAEKAEYASQWLTEDLLCYKNREQMQAKYYLPISYLWSDCDFVTHINNIARTLSNTDRVSFIANLVLCGLQDKLYTRPEITVALISILDEIDNTGLPVERYYELASLYKEMSLIYSRMFKDTDKEITYTEKAASAYRRCYNVSAEYEDSKNMLIAMLSALIPIYAKTGNYLKIDSTYSEIEQILAS